MKKFFTIASLVALTLSACSKESAKPEQESKGQVTINCVVETSIVDTRANVSCTTPAAEDFTLKIEGVDLEYSADYAKIDEFNADSYLHHGNYKATVVAGDLAEEGYDVATFVGSEEFKVEARKEGSVEVTAYIANALVMVEVTENFKHYFEGGYELKLTTAAGNEFNVTAQNELLFIAPESFTVSGTATKQSAQSGKAGVTVTLPEFKQSEVDAQTLYTVTLDVEDAGSATLTISLNDTPVETITIEEELNDYAK